MKKKDGDTPRETRPRGVRPNCSHATTSAAASFARSRRAAAARTAACSSTFRGSRAGFPTRRNTSRKSCRACTTSSSSSPTSTSRRSRWKWGRRRTTSWAACGSMRTRRCQAFPGCLLRANARPALMARTGSAATRSPIFWCSASVRANLPRNLRARNAPARWPRPKLTKPRGMLSRRSTAAPTPRVRIRCSTRCRT